MPSVPLAKVLKPATQLFQRLTTVRVQEAKLTVGLDVGSTTVKAVALGPRMGAGSRPLLGRSLIPLTADQQPDASDAMKAALTALHLPVSSVNLSVSGQWVIMRIIEMPKLKPHELRQALPYEAQRYLPFNIQDVIVDGAVLGPAEANKVWVIIVASKKELIDRRIDWAKRAGVGVNLIDVDVLALVNGYLASIDGQKLQGTTTRAIINVGAQLTNIAILRGAVPYLVRDIPWGGDKLTRNVADQLGIDADAVNKAMVQPNPPADVSNAMKVSSESLATELQLSFDYFENRFNQAPEEIFVAGGLSQSPGFLNALKAQLAQAATPWSPLQGLSAQLAVAYGLALRTN